jgi:hypothetical protein
MLRKVPISAIAILLAMTSLSAVADNPGNGWQYTGTLQGANSSCPSGYGYYDQYYYHENGCATSNNYTLFNRCV